MTDLSKLRVSNTKHGAYKIATLLIKYDKDDVLNHLSSEPGVAIDRPQALKTLAAQNGKVPDFWNIARTHGADTVNGLVLLAIILSHGDHIKALIESKRETVFSGVVERGTVLEGKPFSNFQCILRELGYGTEYEKDVKFDFEGLFKIPGLRNLARSLLNLKLREAGWDGSGSVVDEAVRVGIHNALLPDSALFRDWLETATLEISKSPRQTPKDEEFYSQAVADGSDGGFVFRPGHNPKLEGTVPIASRAASGTAVLRHNQMQTELYQKMSATYGQNSVGTEVPAGDGTAIDLVVKTDSFVWFYEIKTEESVRLCIRQALPQLLEYAYWRGSETANRLIIVGPSKPPKPCLKYLQYLRKRFGLAIDYEQLEITSKTPS